MNWAKLLAFGLVAALVLTVGTHCVQADDAKTVSGKASCGGCSGVVEGCCVMLTDADGAAGSSAAIPRTSRPPLKPATSGKSMTATIVGEPATKKAKDGKEYKEATVKDVKVSS